MNRASTRAKEMEVGRRTGLTLPSKSVFVHDDGLENPEQLFDAAAIVEASPNASIDGSAGRDNDASSALADFAAIESKKPKITVRFSLGDEVADQFDSTTAATIKTHHPVRKLITGNSKSRESIDTMDLSSVSTAPSVPGLKTDVDESDVEASRQSSEETEIAAIVSAAQKLTQSQKPAFLTSSPIAADAPDVGYDDNEDEEDDDMIPPPPPDSPRHDEVEEELHTQPGDESGVDFPNTVDDDENDGPGFDMQDDEPRDDSPGSEQQHQQKQKRSKKLDVKTQEISSRNLKKRPIQSIHDESDSDDAVKPKSRPKKKNNPYSTHFSPKGMPGPRTFTEIPLSDFKPDTPTDSLNVRRSSRIRVAPLEYWRGEKPIFGGNDFGADYDGVKNMPVVIGIAKPDPTPYKKRKMSQL
jgi:centromere protein C